MTFRSIIFLLLTVSFFVSRAQQKPVSDIKDNKPSYGFIENKGQILDQDHRPNPTAKYLLSLPGTNMVLRNNGFSYDTYVTEGKEENITYKYHRIDVEFVGANPTPAITAIDKSSSYITYYTEQDRGIEVHHYGKILYEDVYPGIDVEFIARPGKDKPVEYNFIVHPGADVNQIRLSYNGANESELANGNVELELAYGKLTESIPLSYYLEDKVQTSFRYKQLSSRDDQIVVGFEGEVRTPTQTLIIDPIPTMTFTMGFGGPGEDVPHDIAIDASGNMYVAGFTTSNSGISTGGAHQITYAGGSGDAFVMKFNSAGSIQWGTYYGSTGFDYANAIKLDGSGNVYVAGATHSKAGMSTTGAHQGAPGTASGTDRDGFLVKFNNSGVRQWGTYYGGSADDELNWLTIDGSGNLYLTGVTGSTSAIATASSHQTTLSGTQDAFVVKFNSSGARQWGTYYGGTGSEAGLSIAVDASGNPLATGFTSSSSAIATSGTFQTSYGGTQDAFVVKFNSSGVRQWGTYYGGSAIEETWNVVADASSNIYISGRTTSTSGIASTGTHQTTLGGGNDVFVAKLNSSGGRLWGTYYGGSGSDFVNNGLIVSASNDVIFSGVTASTTGIASPGAWGTSLNGASDSFFSKLSGSTGTRIWGSYIGLPLDDSCDGLTTDAVGTIYITGYNIPSAGSPSSAFIQRYSECSGFNPNITPDATNVTLGTVVTFTAASHLAGNNYAYTYTVNGGPVTVNSTTAQTPITFPAGVFNVTVVTTNSGCSNTTNPPTIIVRPPQPNVADVSFCQGETVILIPSGGPSGSTYNWYTSQLADDPFGYDDLDLGVLAVGDYSYWVETEYDGAYSARKKIDFHVYAKPTPDISPNTTWVYLTQAVTFTAANHQAGNSYQYKYWNNLTPVIVNSTTAQTNVTFPAVNVYSVEATTTDANGCTRVDLFTIEVRPSPPLCQTIIPIVSTGTLKLDTFSGQVVLTPSTGCAEDFIVGCVAGKVTAPLLTNVVAASATAYSDDWDRDFLKVSASLQASLGNMNIFEKSERGKWRPKSTHTFNNPINYQAKDKNYEAGVFQLAKFNFQYPELSKRTGWLQVTRIDKYTRDGDAVEEFNALEIASAAKIGYGGSVPYLVAQNADYGSVYFESFENIYPGTKLEENGDLNGGDLVNSYHSGKTGLSLTGTFKTIKLTVNAQMRTKGLQLRFWVKGDVSQSAVIIGPATTKTVGSPSSQPTASGSVPPDKFDVIARSGEWALLESKITGISSDSEELTISISKGSGAAVWIDDIRIQPFDAEMTCYVYDTRTLQLLAVFDDQHFGMFYQYNAEGKLIRKIVETERGIRTIQEKQYNVPTISKTSPLGN